MSLSEETTTAPVRSSLFSMVFRASMASPVLPDQELSSWEPWPGALAQPRPASLDGLMLLNPSVNKHSYGKLPFLVEFPIGNGDFL